MAAGVAAGAPLGSVTTSPDRLRQVWSTPGCHCLFGMERRAPTARWGEPHKIFDIRGAIGRVAFSPDGRRIAFENLRGDLTANNPKGEVSLRGFEAQRSYAWSFIATYDFYSRRIDYVDPTFFEDRAPVWSTSGRTISFSRHGQGETETRETRPAPGLAAKIPWTAPPSVLAALLETPVVFQSTASDNGRAFVYSARQGEGREIDLKLEGQPARRLVAYGGDDGQDLTDLALSPQGDVMAYVRGGPANRVGDVPNPRSLPDKPEREVWVLATSGGKGPQNVGLGSKPRFTRDGRNLVWTDKTGLKIAPLLRRGPGSAGIGQASTIIAGDISEVAFSPSGDRLLYKSGDSLGVYDLTTDQTWMIERPKDAIDSDAVWSPDGTRIAFIRTKGPQPKLISDGLLGFGGPYLSAIPWAIFSAEISTRTITQIWQAKAGRGSAYFPMDEDATGVGHEGAQLLWGAGDTLVFVWELDGWRHLYAVPAAGGEARLLTPGDGEVETATLSLDGRHVIAATNIGDLGRRHLHRIEIATGASQPLTLGDASQWAPTALADGGVAFIDAGWADPPAMKIWRPDGQVAATGLPRVATTFPRHHFVRPELVEVAAADGARAFGQLFRPRLPTGCGVIFAHGGIQRQMLPGFHYMEGYSNLYEINQYLASRGCAVLSIEYRSSIMRGYDFRNAAGWGNAGASEMSDVVGAAKALTSDPSLKVQKVGIWGLSWGGYITAQALATRSDVFAAGFDVAGVHEFFGEREKYGPLAAAGSWRSPIFLAQGDDDRNVDFYQGVRLARALSARKDVSAVFRVVPDDTHDINLTLQHLVTIYGEGADFLVDHLTDRSKLPPSP
jgi:dipeptidyl aminopeptidase/acylaminoacyl peptidase